MTKEELYDLHINKKLNLNKISKLCGKHKNHIRNLFKQLDVPFIKYCNKKYFANDNYFSTWSHNMAYCLGFIAADGHVWKDRPFLTIGIHHKDIEVLNFIRNEISPTTKIRPTKDKIQINIHSTQIWNDLNKLGIKNNKTFNIKLHPDIPNEYWGDFIRGLFDGDGAIWKSKKGKYTDYYCGSIVSASKDFIVDIRKRLDFGRIQIQRKKYYYLEFPERDLLKLKNLMYCNQNCFKLQRKYQKFLLINHYSPWWTTEEIELLTSIIKQNYNIKPRYIDKSLFPNRSLESIQWKLKQIKNEIIKNQNN